MRDDERRVAAEFERRLLDAALGDGLHDEATDARRAREADGTHARVAHQCFHRRLRIAEHHVEDTRRETGLFCELRERECGERRFVRGLHDDCAACCERRCSLAGDHRVGEIPRGDQGGDADGFHDRAEMCAVDMRWDRAAVQSLSFMREPFDEARAVCDFARCLGEWLALFQGEDACEVVLMALDQFVPAEQYGSAFCGWDPAPGFECAMCGVDCLCDLVCFQHRDVADYFLICRVLYRYCRSCFAVDPAAVDVTQ
ncbi:hypothetical protein BCAR13_200062 [Paraburkholderia caribensis]|nr:hypothetical protein BCAR13_200062 [Paraburkholderia caribensis]